MPSLHWIGKDKVIAHHRDVPLCTLRPVYGFTAAGGSTATPTESGNLVIHGDNLLALKALLPRYEGAVDCVYIDPPYNTGNEGWVYNDAVSDPQMRRWLGQVVGKEGEDLSRHDKWLCMMMPRLSLLRDLLAPTGVIFISIDDNECASLKLLCDEVFGERCFVADVSWQRTYSPRNDSQGIVSEAEHLLVYGRRPDWMPAKLERTAEMNAKYKNPDNDVAPWRGDNAFGPNARTHQGMVYAIQHPFTGNLIYPVNTNCWRYSQSEMLEIMNGWCAYHLEDIHDEARRAEVCGIATEDVRKGVPAIVLTHDVETSRAEAQKVYNRGQWPKYYFTKGGQGGIARKTYLKDEGRIVTNLWPYAEVGHTDEAKKELKGIFGGKIPFDTPKPTRLIERILQIVGKADALVLDSFAGSGTTAQAVLNLNRKDGGRRRFILVEMMDYADRITAERVKRVMAGYAYTGRKVETVYSKKLTAQNLQQGPALLAEAEAAAAEAAPRYTRVSRPKVAEGCLTVEGMLQVQEHMPGLGGAFDYCELGPTLLTDDGLLNEAVGTEALRRYVYYTETRQPLPQPADAAQPYRLGVHSGTAYYFCYDPRAEVVLGHALANRLQGDGAERRVVYADACTLSAAECERRGIVFKKIPRDIRRY